MGGLVAAMGFYGYVHGSRWFRGYNATTGTFGIGPTLGFVALGLVFVVIGLIPWERIRR
jgi:hypothetical protein